MKFMIFGIYFSLLQSTLLFAKAELQEEGAPTEPVGVVLEEERAKAAAAKNRVVPATTDEKKSYCSSYEGKYIASIGSKLFYVRKKNKKSSFCVREALSQIEAQQATKSPDAVILKVDKKVIAALPLVEKKAKYSYKKVYKKYKGSCITAGKIIYRVVSGGKRAYPDRLVGLDACDGDIEPVEYGELRVLPDKIDFPAPKQLYRPKEEKKLVKLSPRKVCAALKNQANYSFHSKIYRFHKSKKACYLEELDKFSMDIRMTLEKNIPKELTPSQYFSLMQLEAPKSD